MLSYNTPSLCDRSPDGTKTLEIYVDDDGITHILVNGVEKFEVLEKLTWGVTSGVAGVTANGSVWSGWMFDADTGSYVYVQPFRISQKMADNKANLYVLVVYYVQGAVAGDIYFDLSYGVRTLGEVLGMDQDPYDTIVIGGGEENTLKTWQYQLDQSLIEAGKFLGMTLGRSGTNILDTYADDMVVMTAYIVKI